MLGIACMCTGALTFLLAKTTVMPHRPASALVTHGIYAYTRNPMYLGFTTAYVGAALAAGLVMPLVLLPPVLFLLTVFVIRREERYLRDTFPATFDAYASRVRRWL
jgi:protein-S-isoprenylcysteine O-methyltransferase Ste14